MNWLTNYVRPKLQKLVGPVKDIPDNMWDKCPNCNNMIFVRTLEQNLKVCHHCEYHFRIGAKERMELLFDNSEYSKVQLPKVEEDPLKFKDIKKYSDRIKEYRKKIGEDDAIMVAHGKINGTPAVIAALDFSFMGGSMGTAVGEGISAAAELACLQEAALIIISSSGGARMQEGILSLMQMAKTTAAVLKVKEKGLPYISVLSDPTTGGVSASYAMLGDVNIAEPKAIIGFAGRRVIEQTIKKSLPDDFQKAEYLLEHGMVDIVSHRKDLKENIGKIIDILINKTPSGEVIKIKAVQE